MLSTRLDMKTTVRFNYIICTPKRKTENNNHQWSHQVYNFIQSLNTLKEINIVQHAIKYIKNITEHLLNQL